MDVYISEEYVRCRFRERKAAAAATAAAAASKKGERAVDATSKEAKEKRNYVPQMEVSDFLSCGRVSEEILLSCISA
ncbi:hypothetical protein AMTR_s00009p00257620 [Amborella trichopoda]|uniref:Uncharacterized protein n=1 Tax=Amborella trichopoda TaxID=13333 RepID=W1NHZ6_AMBTC|nr:hypothetical protein AMTR_s00009p00257620 [Amborella trichopoda]